MILHGVKWPYHYLLSMCQIPGSARKGYLQSAVVLLEPVYKIEVGQALSSRQVVSATRSGNAVV